MSMSTDRPLPLTRWKRLACCTTAKVPGTPSRTGPLMIGISSRTRAGSVERAPMKAERPKATKNMLAIGGPGRASALGLSGSAAASQWGRRTSSTVWPTWISSSRL